jgi:murein DD-endopeptidase MepM/ murein hydrolase activator NlpD
VRTAAWHPEYGQMLEVDHGNGLVTRYAHTSKILVKVGELVKRGQVVANVGTTGRSTGPHLHFEVLVDGVPQDRRSSWPARPARMRRTSRRCPACLRRRPHRRPFVGPRLPAALVGPRPQGALATPGAPTGPPALGG